MIPISRMLPVALAALSSTASADITVSQGPVIGPTCQMVATVEATSYTNVERDRFTWPGCLLDFPDIWMDQVDPSHSYWAGYDDDAHAVLVFHNKVTNNGRLLVLLPGLPASTKTYRAFGERAARAGYHVIVLPYWNAPADDDDPTVQYPGNNWGASGYDCNTLVAPDVCYSELYGYSTLGTALATGGAMPLAAPGRYSPPGGGVGAPEDSVEHRLRMTIAFVAAKWPTQGWSSFVDGSGNPVWSSIVLSGHSHGTSNIANLSRSIAVHGVIFLEGPNDYEGSATSPIPPSFLYNGATAGSVMYVLDNESDTSRLPRVRANIDTLQVGTVGSSGVHIDDTTDFSSITAHRLWAHGLDSTHPNGTPTSCDPHMSTGTGCSGYFNKAWDYLLDRVK